MEPLHVEYAERSIENGIIFTHLARFMNTVTLNVNLFLSNTGFAGPTYTYSLVPQFTVLRRETVSD